MPRILNILLLTFVVTLFCVGNVPTVEAGRITCKSTAGVKDKSIKVLEYIAANVDHDVCVTSAIRAHSHNSRVGGASLSQHLPENATALDISTAGLTETQEVNLTRLILSHPDVNGYGWYNSKSVHFDTRPTRTGAGYWSDKGGSYSSKYFDEKVRAGNIIHPLIVEMVYRWSKSGTALPFQQNTPEQPLAQTTPAKPLTYCTDPNVPLDPNSAEATALLGSNSVDQQTCAQLRIQNWQQQNSPPGSNGAQPPYTPPPTSPSPNNQVPPIPFQDNYGTNPGTQTPGNGQQSVFPQYSLPGSPPTALSPNATQPPNTTPPNTSVQPNQPLTPGVTPTPSVKQCSASSTPSTAKKLPTMSAQEWDRAVRILYAESGSCKLGKNDGDCIKVAETFRNRLIASLETGRYSCWRTWDRILTFTNAPSCGYFDKLGIRNATRLQAGSKTYQDVEQALFQAIYGGTNLSLGNLHNYTRNYQSRVVNQSSIVPAGNNYTYIKHEERRVDISPYHFPNCADITKLQPTDPNQLPPPNTTVQPNQPQTTPTQPTTFPGNAPQNPNRPNITPIQPQRSPGALGAGQSFMQSAVPGTPNYGLNPTTNQPYATSLQQAVQAQQQYTAAQNQLRQQQQELLRQQEEQPHRDIEIRKQLDELERKQDDLLQQQLEALKQQQTATQRKPSGKRTVTVIAAPNLDNTGVILNSLAGKLQARGHDVIMMPDAINYQPQLDAVLSELKVLPENLAINCVGWGKGALGCIALAKQVETLNRKLHHLVLLDPNEGLDGSTVPGVAAIDFANNRININIAGKVILYVPETGSTLFVNESTEAQAVQVDEVNHVPTSLGQLSMGLDPNVQNQIVTALTNGSDASSATGNLYNIDLVVGTALSQKVVGLEGLLYLFQLSKHDHGLVTPIVLLHWLGQSIGSLFGSSDDTSSRTVSTDDLSQDLYLLLIQELLFPTSNEIEDTKSDITVTALKATKTLSDQYRFIGSLTRTFEGDIESLRSARSYFDPSVTNELLIDYTCDGTIDDGATFYTPYDLVLPTADGAEATISESLPIEEDGIHCFAFVADADNVVDETNESNNTSPWREFVVGFGAVLDTPTEDLPGLNFEVSVHNANYSQMTQDWTNENVTISAGQEIAFRWDAPEYDVCSPLLSSLTPDILDNRSPANRNTLTEKIDLEERTGYYELRCGVEGDMKVETIHVTVQE